MQLLKVTVAMLMLECCVFIVNGEHGQSVIDTSSLFSVGTIDMKGFNLRVFEIDGVQVAEPRITFGDTCDSLRYNNLYLKYQLTLPINIDVNPPINLVSSSTLVDRVTVIEINVEADRPLASKDAQVTVITKSTRSAEAFQLVFLCDTFSRCQQLQDDIGSDPEEIWSLLKFIVVVRFNEKWIKFVALRSANLPAFHCTPGRWVVFQRRVNGSLSFAKNWDAYVKGFGSPKSNYWMGLDKLSSMTVISRSWETSRCRLRIELEDFSGVNYWGEYHMFQVLGPEENYRLRVGVEVTGSQMKEFVSSHGEKEFSTYDRDHDTNSHAQCSREFGYGGWWYGSCHALNLNGAYPTDETIQQRGQPYDSAYFGNDKYLPMRRTLMKFRCD